MRKDYAVAGILGLIYFLALFAGSILFMMWIFKNLVTIGVGLLTIAIPIFLIIVSAVLVKKYLMGG